MYYIGLHTYSSTRLASRHCDGDRIHVRPDYRERLYIFSFIHYLEYTVVPVGTNNDYTLQREKYIQYVHYFLYIIESRL